MKEFLQALAISLGFVLGGYVISQTFFQPGNMDMSEMDMTSGSGPATEGMGTMSGMSH